LRRQLRAQGCPGTSREETELVMSIAQSVNDPQQDTAEDVNPPDQGSELGESYYWVEDAS
jgi:hypothetical protein